MMIYYTSSIAASGTINYTDSMKRCVCHHAHAYNAPINVMPHHVWGNKSPYYYEQPTTITSISLHIYIVTLQESIEK